MDDEDPLSRNKPLRRDAWYDSIGAVVPASALFQCVAIPRTFARLCRSPTVWVAAQLQVGYIASDVNDNSATCNRQALASAMSNYFAQVRVLNDLCHYE